MFLEGEGYFDSYNITAKHEASDNNWVQIVFLAYPPSFVNLGKLFNLLGPQLTHPENGYDNDLSFTVRGKYIDAYK